MRDKRETVGVCKRENEDKRKREIVSVRQRESEREREIKRERQRETDSMYVHCPMLPLGQSSPC